MHFFVARDSKYLKKKKQKKIYKWRRSTNGSVDLQTPPANKWRLQTKRLQVRVPTNDQRKKKKKQNTRKSTVINKKTRIIQSDSKKNNTRNYIFNILAVFLTNALDHSKQKTQTTKNVRACQDRSNEQRHIPPTLQANETNKHR